LYKLPVVKDKVYRGIGLDLSKDFKKDQTVIWWGFNSTSTNLGVMDTFFAKSGARTMFHIAVESGVSIKGYSAFPEEVWLLRGTCLKVDAIIQVNYDVPFIQMSELVIPWMLVYSRKMPFNIIHFPVPSAPFIDLSEKKKYSDGLKKLIMLGHEPLAKITAISESSQQQQSQRFEPTTITALNDLMASLTFLLPNLPITEMDLLFEEPNCPNLKYLVFNTILITFLFLNNFV